MYQQRGFSLIEVLVSLLLVITLAFTLLQQQWQNKQLAHQLILRAQGTNLLDQIEESFTAKIEKISSVPAPFHLNIEYENQEILIQLTWLNHKETRKWKRLGTNE